VPFQITVKVKDAKKINAKALAQQLANAVESLTGRRAIVNVRQLGGK
jgi:hypothetical protein